jgi:hypothetical protein
MTARDRAGMREIVAKYEHELLSDWVDNQMRGAAARPDLMKSDELKDQSRRFLELSAKRRSRRR